MVASPRYHRCQHLFILAMGGCFLSRRQCQDAAEIAFEAKHRAPVFAGAGRDHDPADERPNVVVRLKPGPFVGQGLDQPVDPLAVFLRHRGVQKRRRLRGVSELANQFGFAPFEHRHLFLHGR